MYNFIINSTNFKRLFFTSLDGEKSPFFNIGLSTVLSLVAPFFFLSFLVYGVNMPRDVYGKSSESVATIDLSALTYVVARVLTSEGSDFGLDTRGVLCSFSELFQIFSSSAHSRFLAQIYNALPALFGNMPRPIGCFRRIEFLYQEKNIKLKIKLIH